MLYVAPYWPWCWKLTLGERKRGPLLLPALTGKESQDWSFSEWWQRVSLGQTQSDLGPRLCVCMLSCFSCVWLFATLWTIAHQAPLSMRFPRNEYFSGLPCPPPGDLSDPGIEPMSLKSPALAGGLVTTSVTLEAPSAQVIAGSKTPQLLMSLHSSGRK